MKIIVKNFQSISEAEIIADKFTVIVGPSDKGKSALIRAIKSCFLNNKGDWFVKHGEKQASVQIIDEYDLLWEKGKGVNRQVLDKEEYSKVGFTTPEAIQDVTKVREISIDKELSITPQIQDQHDYAFLLNKSESQISAAISFLAKTDRVLAASKLCQADLKETKSKIKYKNEEDEQLTSKLISIEAPLNNTKSLFDQLELLEQDIISDSQLIVSIDSYITLNNKVKELVGSLTKVVDIKTPDTSSIIELLSIIESYLKLQPFSGFTLPETPQDLKVSDNLNILSTIESFIVLYKAVSVSMPIIETTAYDDITKNIETLQGMESFLIGLKDVNDVKDSLDKTETSIKDIEVSITKLQDELGVCPTCNQEFGNHAH